MSKSCLGSCMDTHSTNMHIHSYIHIYTYIYTHILYIPLHLGVQGLPALLPSRTAGTRSGDASPPRPGSQLLAMRYKTPSAVGQITLHLGLLGLSSFGRPVQQGGENNAYPPQKGGAAPKTGTVVFCRFGPSLTSDM